MNFDRDRALQIHCQDMAVQRMKALLTEAQGTGSGWNVELLQAWTEHNKNLMLLMNATRKLLPF